MASESSISGGVHESKGRGKNIERDYGVGRREGEGVDMNLTLGDSC